MSQLGTRIASFVELMIKMILHLEYYHGTTEDTETVKSLQLVYNPPAISVKIPNNEVAFILQNWSGPSNTL